MQMMTRIIIFALICCGFGARAQCVTIGPLTTTELAPTIERRVHLVPPGPNASRYVYVPFEVGPHATRISISYQYDRAKGANTIDIGLFDARSTGSDTDPRGFRGWSGGRRSEFFVSRAEATPGYLRGAMPAGTWRIIFGLYQVAPGGVDVTLKIDVETGPGPQRVTRGELRDNTTANVSSTVAAGSNSRRGALWWTGDLHMHTVHSDGTWTIPELITSGRNAGLDFIVITDHNTASHHEEIDRLSKGLRRPLVMRGEEITTYGGHTNAWGLPSGTWIDFRTHPGDTSRINKIAAMTHRTGAVISINHPFVLCGGCAWSYDPAARNFDAIEVWNGPWDFTDEPAIKMWDKILQSGRRITAIASSDSHRPDTPIGKPATHLAAKVLSQAALLTAIRGGHAYLTDAVGRVIYFEADETGMRRSRWIIGDVLHLSAPGKVNFFVSGEGFPSDATVSVVSNGETIRSFPLWASSDDGRSFEVDCQRNSYFRLEVRDGRKSMLALTNPIYVRVGRDR